MDKHVLQLGIHLLHFLAAADHSHQQIDSSRDVQLCYMVSNRFHFTINMIISTCPAVGLELVSQKETRSKRSHFITVTNLLTQLVTLRKETVGLLNINPCPHHDYYHVMMGKN